MNLNNIKTPAYLIDEALLEKNLKQLAKVKHKTGCKILLATKAYSCYHTYSLISNYLDGTTNSSVNEALLSAEEFGKETHLYSPAYKKEDILAVKDKVETVIFNSQYQYETFSPLLNSHSSCGLRINPEHIEVDNPMYNPCAPGSRFGVLAKDMKAINLQHIAGFHIHALCQNNEDSLGRLMASTAEKFHEYLMLDHIKWVNFGGGHMISRSGYNIDELCDHISHFQQRYNIQVILEPGEAVVYEAGFLVSEVLDIVENNMNIAILDTSATAHMPDVIEMPYRPDVIAAGKPDQYSYTYRLGGITCLSGDIIGEYSFAEPLKVGQKCVFTDMAQYTMVKNTHFNGIQLPYIYIKTIDGELILKKSFTYTDFKQKL